jgi:hypothetical protein
MGELLREKITEYDCSDGWYVFGSCHTSRHIGLVILGRIIRTKKIIKPKRTDYYDKACTLADKRNYEQGYRVKYYLPKIKK